MRRLLAIAAILVVAVAVVVLGTRASGDEPGGYKVRVIFDNAFALVEGEDVRVAGVRVGQLESLDVTEDNRAAVVLDITDPAFQDFRRDASCAIRPQSLIGERYIECRPTAPRAAGEAPPPPLPRIERGTGEGQRLLPVERTSRPVDTDLLNNVMRLPQRQRLAIIINEIGAGVAARGDDLNETIRRANPALQATNRVLGILAEQNRVLADLAEDSDRVLAPLARERDSVAGFIENANTTARATAERRADLERTFERLPRFLDELRPTMDRLGSLSGEMAPVLEDLGAQAPAINRVFSELGPFSRAAIPSFRSLGEAAEVGRPALVRSKPIIDDLRRLTDEGRPLARDLRELTVSLQETGGIERLMDFIFFGTASVNGFDGLGHYLRASLLVNNCSQYSNEPAPGCDAGIGQNEANGARAAANDPARVKARYAKLAKENPKALKMPGAMLPEEQQSKRRRTQPQPKAAPPRAASPSAPSPTQEGLLDYLMGDEAP